MIEAMLIDQRAKTRRKSLQRIMATFFSMSVAFFSASNTATPIELPPNYIADSLLTRWLEPTYPADAFSNGTTGKVTIEFDINKFGQVVDPLVVTSAPSGIFDEAVIRTLDHWTVYPYLASRCFQEFPRSRVTVSFNIESGKPIVKASRPLPLIDPSKKKSTISENGVTGTDTATIPDQGEKPNLRWTSTPLPNYPKRFGSERHAANVVAKLTIEPDGTVGKIEVIFSSIHQDFSDASVEAFKKWKAGTATGDMPSVPVVICQPLSFRPPVRIPVVD